ncbi:MAG TPA: hypothetical protein VK427_27315, partial [Kofleriaceae bacterium]|nr:hypothetical protein [Kofleriaceae bacterium]
VRARLLRRYASQRPEVEGPAHRRLFELDRVDDAAAASVTGRDGVYEIQTGLLGGDRVGDVYAVLPVNAVAHDVGKEVAKLQVVAVHPVISQATLAGGAASLHVGAVAVPIIRTAPKHPVRVDVHEDAFDSVAAAVAATPTLFVANPSDPAPLASLKLTGDMLSVEDAGGPLLVGARFPEELTSVLKCIAGLGVARSLYSLLGEHGVHAREVEVELGVVYGGERRSIPPTGAALGLRDRVYISVKNRSDRPLWFHVLNVGLRGTISSQTSRQFPGGVRLEGSSEPFIVGGGEGIQLAWPDGLPRGTFPRTDTIVVFATTTSADLQSIETHALAPTRRTAGTPLETLVAQMRDGVDRSAAAVDGFFATRVSFELHPRDAAMGGLSFDIDDAPGILSAARAPAAWHAGGDAPTSDVDDERAIVIRAVELVVDDASGSGGPDVRIDALVCTRSVDGQFATWSQYLEPAASHRFTDDAAVLFRGRVRDFVDIALFVSRDDGRRLALAELFAERASHADVAAACKGLVAAPGTPWVTAVGSSAVLARMAYGLLRGLAGHSMGLYRTSFLAHEEFGVGRHPRAGVYRAQNISFSLLVAGAEM